jgi:hypothetical protein
MSQQKIDNVYGQTILEQKLSFINTGSQVSMLWWASSVVFCATIVGVVWLNRSTLINLPPELNFSFIILVVVFFITVVNYGFLVITATKKVKSEIPDLMKELEIPNPVHNIFDTEFSTLRKCIWNGISSFAILSCIWILMWAFILLS